MAKTKISKIAKDLNVSLPTVIDFLRKRNINIDESPNTRVEDDVVALLMSAFKSDKDLKNRSSQITTERKENRAKAATSAKEEAPKEEPLTTFSQKPRILGKLELDSKGNPIVRTPEATPAPEPKTEAAPTPAPKAEVAPTPKAPEATTETPKAPITPKETPKEAPETPNAEAASAPKAPETPITPTAAPAAEVPKEEIFTIERTAPAPSLNIVGKIDLEALNQNTRPKKKSRDERRGGRPGAPGASSAEADRKKRRRIAGKEKVDIEKVGQSAGNRDQRSGNGGGNNGGGENNRRGGNGGGNNNSRGSGENRRQQAKGGNRNTRPVTPEVSEEDVQKQV